MTRRLRIAVFVHEFPALSETFVLNQVCGLLEKQHDVTIFAVRPRDDSVVHADVDRFNLLSKTRYLGMPGNRIGRILEAIRYFVSLDRKSRRKNFRTFAVWRYGQDAASLRLLFWARRLKNETPFDIIHAHFGPLGQLAAKLRDAGILQGRLVTVFHGVDISAYTRARPNFYRFLFAKGDLFLPISQTWHRKLIELGCDAKRAKVHHMGIDSNRYLFEPRRWAPNEPLRLLTVGRLVEKKGVEYALLAVSKLVRQGREIEYSIVGDGPLRPALERVVREQGLMGCVHFLGWRNQNEVSELMTANHILIAPSVTGMDGDQEGIPVTLMEAMATGMPVISTVHSGIPELIAHERSGILVAERDIEGLTTAIEALASTPMRWTEIGRAARDAVGAEFEISRLNGRLEREFFGLLELRRSKWTSRQGAESAQRVVTY